MLFLSFLNDLPKLIRESVNSLMKFILCGFIFAEIRELITKVIEILDELLEFLLLSVRAMNKVKILLLEVIKVVSHSFTLDSHLSEDSLHLLLVSVAQLFPYLEDSWLEVTVDVCDTWILGGDPLSCGLRSLNLGTLILLGGLAFRAFILGPLFLFLFLSGFPKSLGFSGLSLINLLIDPSSNLSFFIFLAC